jgi:hypothetical protein
MHCIRLGLGAGAEPGGGGLEYEHALLRKALAWRTEPREKLLAQLHPARRRFSRHRRRLEAGVRQRPDLMGSAAAGHTRVDSNICLVQAVGCLRAANNYTGKPARARDAKIIVWLGCIGTCINLFAELLQGYDAYQTVLKTPYAIDGPSRREFVREFAEVCVKKGRTDMTPEQVSKYCRCMGNAFADIATPRDLGGQDIDAARSRVAALVEKCI